MNGKIIIYGDKIDIKITRLFKYADRTGLLIVCDLIEKPVLGDFTIVNLKVGKIEAGGILKSWDEEHWIDRDSEREVGKTILALDNTFIIFPSFDEEGEEDVSES